MDKRKIVIINVFIGIIIGLLVMPSIMLVIWIMGSVGEGNAFFWLLMLQLALFASLGILILAAIKGEKGNLALQILAFFASFIVFLTTPIVLLSSIWFFEWTGELVILLYLIPVFLMAALIILIKRKGQLILLQEGVEGNTKAAKMIFKILAAVAMIALSYMALLGYMEYLYEETEKALLVSIPIIILVATIIMLAICGQKSRGEKVALKILIGIGLIIEFIFLIYFILAIVRLY